MDKSFLGNHITPAVMLKRLKESQAQTDKSIEQLERAKRLPRGIMQWVIGVILLTSIAAAEPMTKTDKQMEWTFAALQVIDWAQTRTISKNPHLFIETNSIFGDHPSIGRVDTLMAAGLVSHYLVARSLKGNTRRAFQLITIGWEAGFATNNYRTGIWLTLPLR